MKKIFGLLCLILATSAFAVDTKPIGNPVSGGATSIFVNDGGTIKEALNISPSTGISGGGFAAQNFLINGNMAINQRGAASYTVTGWTLDRWYLWHNHTSANVSQQDIDYAVPGAKYAIRITNNTQGAGTYLGISQSVETANFAPLIGKPATFSAWVRKSAGMVNGTLTMKCSYSASEDATALTLTAIAATDIGVLNIPASSITTTFQKFSTVCPFPSTARGMQVVFRVTSPSAAQQYDITNAMLNEGSVAAPFQLAGADVQGELAKAQRYFEKSYELGTAPGTATSASLWFTAGLQGVTTTGEMRSPVVYKVTKRASASVKIYDATGNGGTVGKCNRSNYAIADNNNSNCSASYSYWNGFHAESSSGAAATALVFHWTADAEL